MKNTFTQALIIVKQYNLCMHGKLISKPTLKEFRESLSIIIDSIEAKKLTQAYLVKFGNYLLSEKREQSIHNKENIKEVHQEDLDNFETEEI